MQSLVSVPPPPVGCGRVEGMVLVTPWRAWWVVQAPFTYRTPEGWRITIPESFITDFASIPRVLWPLFPPTDERYRVGSLAHDFIYERHEILAGDGETPLHISRALGDRTFQRAAVCASALRQVLWAGVRLGGAGSYASGAVRQRERRALLGLRD